MMASIVIFSDERIRFEIEPDPDNPSLFIHQPGGGYVRQFMTNAQIVELKRVVNAAQPKTAAEAKSATA
jgi:hypothetical protein